MKNREKTNKEIIEEYDYLGNAASTSECTGLIQTGDTSEEELEKYKEIYRFGAPVIDDESAIAHHEQ